MLLQGPLTDLGTRRLSEQVRKAFQTFFDPDDASGLQAEFSAMLAHVAARYADHPAVIGFELFNEPDAGTVEVDAFHARAGAAVRAAAPDKLMFFEPSALRNFTDFLPTPKEPFPIEGAVYSPHVYTFVFQADQRAFQSATPEILEPSVRAAREEATAFETPLWVGEFGIGPSTDPQHDVWMRTQQQLHDRYFASNAFWLWKEHSQASWGVHEYHAATDSWTERPQVVGWISRVHAVRIAGTPKRLESSALGDSLTLELEPGSAVGAPTQIYVPERFRATTTATCDGAEIVFGGDPTTGIAEVACAGVLVVAPR
jgi:endoglycosylceramidase